MQLGRGVQCCSLAGRQFRLLKQSSFCGWRAIRLRRYVHPSSPRTDTGKTPRHSIDAGKKRPLVTENPLRLSKNLKANMPHWPAFLESQATSSAARTDAHTSNTTRVEGPPMPKPPKGRKSKHAWRKYEKALAEHQAGLNAKNDLNPNHHAPQEEAEPRPARKEKKAMAAHSRPSELSGGVPNPTTRYLLHSTTLPTVLPLPRRILVIIDLNGTLLHRPSRQHPSHFIERPYTKAFLEYCISNFVVGIWSSARPQNVSNMVAGLLTSEQMSKCAFVWSRDKFRLSAEDYNAHVQCYKRLTQVWSDVSIQTTHPFAMYGQFWDQSNTILIDDSIEKGRSEPHNLVEIPEFSGMAEEQAEVLPQVHDYLNILCYQGNISSFVRQHPFRLNPQYRLPVMLSS